jgi:hypothetical protein
MDPMSAFERQLSRVASELAGPVKPVDATAVARSAKATPARGRSVFARWRRRRPAITERGGTEPRSPILEQPLERLRIVTGRTFTMLSPAKAIVAGALLALGGLFLIAQPVAPPEVAVPGAETLELQGVTVTASLVCVEAGDAPGGCTWTASDPRLTGTGTGQFTGDISDDREGEGLRTGLSWLDHTLEGPEGGWSGHEYLMWIDPFHHFLVLSGSGAYEGWHYVASAITEAGPPFDWTGILYEGELPPFGP